MRLRTLVPIGLGFVLVLMLTACPRVDLRPEGRSDLTGPISYCRTQEGDLVVTVSNQGTENAPASTTTVAFTPGGSFDLATPAIPAGGSVDLAPLNFPLGCFNPDCDFRITVDSRNVIPESNEGNNSADGICIG